MAKLSELLTENEIKKISAYVGKGIDIRDMTVQQFLDYSIEWLKVSDVVYIVPNMEGLINWTDSTGTLKEIEIANELEIPVIFTMG